jgi:hypothetical protein
MKFSSAVALCAFLFASTASAERSSTDIYDPQIKYSGLEDLDEVERQHGTIGIGFSNTVAEKDELKPGVNLSARYFAGERWYVTGELGFSSFLDESFVLEEREQVFLANAGVGYALLQGTASTFGNYTFPWLMAVEVAMGSQHTGDTRGRYTALGLSWQIKATNYWYSFGARQYRVDDQRLKTLGANEGMQWNLSFGIYY